MKIYLAHNFEARDILLEDIKSLNRLGHEVTSSWIYNSIGHNALKPQTSALIDLTDIDRADALLLYTANFGGRPGRGKYIEFGYAIASHKLIFIYGDKDDSIFFELPNVIKINGYEQIAQYEINIINGTATPR